MIYKLSETIVDWLVKNKAIEKTERILYQYAIESIFLSLLTVMLALLIGLFFGNVIQSLVLITPFMFLRKFSGGYHAKNLKICIVGSSLLIFLSLVLSTEIRCSQELALITILFSAILAFFSPIENENRILEKQEKKAYKIITIVLVQAFLFLAATTYLYGLADFTKSICIGIQLSAALQIPCILEKTHGKILLCGNKNRKPIDQKCTEKVVSCKRD